MTARTRIRSLGNTLQTVARIRMRDTAGVLRTIQRVRMRNTANVLQTVFQYLLIALDKIVVTGNSSGAASSGTVTSGNVTGTPSGGTPAYTYLWLYVDGDATITPGTGTLATTNFSAASVPDGIGKIARYQLRVTDSIGAVALSSPVEIQLYWIDTR